MAHWISLGLTKTVIIWAYQMFSGTFWVAALTGSSRSSHCIEDGKNSKKVISGDRKATNKNIKNRIVTVNHMTHAYYPEKLK